jgi:hypothetical protein
MELSATSLPVLFSDVTKRMKTTAGTNNLTPISEIIKEILDQYELTVKAASEIKDESRRRSTLALLKKDVDDWAREIEREC